MLTRNISTHSLTRRLTDLDSNAMGASDISTHSLTRRLTPHHRRQSNL